MRSHPPTLLTLARRAIEDHELIPPRGRVLAAVSGGPDSMALLHVLAILGKKMCFEVVAHGVDHGLRVSAKRELDLAARFARALDVEFSRTKVRVEKGGNLQARAREARHAALERARVSAKADVIATAHHADDRAETVMLRILRGTGARGLGVLPSRAAHAPLVRPLLLARRADIECHIQRHDVPFSVDPSNADPRFLRSRVRHELIPLMNELNPGAVDHLCRLAAELLDPEADPEADSEES
ncbi:MAG: tRNA lysidine(34) synthetase TilS [Polyangiaceae bacterium]